MSRATTDAAATLTSYFPQHTELRIKYSIVETVSGLELLTSLTSQGGVTDRSTQDLFTSQLASVVEERPAGKTLKNCTMLTIMSEKARDAIQQVLRAAGRAGDKVKAVEQPPGSAHKTSAGKAWTDFSNAASAHPVQWVEPYRWPQGARWEHGEDF